jgi:alpha-1,2-mannosyltransferase
MILSLITYYDDINHQNQNQNLQKIKINVISGRKDDKEKLFEKLKTRFGIEFKNNIMTKTKNKLVLEVELITMNSGYMLRPKNFLTMFLQILAQIYFAIEIITKVYSDVYCDTTGLPFTYFILKYLGHAKVSAYTHYPFISNDMIYQVQNNISGIHSRGNLNKNKFIRKIKLYYYNLIMKMYKFMGNKCLSFAYVNSTWTFNHMKELWDNLYKQNKLQILYPPCSISLYKEAAKNDIRENIIVSFAQFRPEKRQEMQIRILSKLRKKLAGEPEFNDLELHIIGGVRNNEDKQIFDNLNDYANKLHVGNYVKFIPNGTVEQITEEFSKAKIGIHTMFEEHFGITLIEMMAAGLIVVTHNSAGAKNDILKSDGEMMKPGFLVNDENEYVSQIEEILRNYNEIKGLIINNSTQRAEKFSDEAFKEKFLYKLKEFLL